MVIKCKWYFDEEKFIEIPLFLWKALSYYGKILDDGEIFWKLYICTGKD